jgi:aromatic ring-opening dioxygenase catalytic subunit (LigB family)
MKLPTYFLSHGGGPWPFMKAELGSTYDQLEESLKKIPSLLPLKPKAILVITAHWIEDVFSVASIPEPQMIYDYFGFPEHTYSVQYRALGSPELAQKVAEKIKKAGVDAQLDPSRGYDHGTFVPLHVVFPEADIPVVQLSIRNDFDPRVLMEVGRALAPLRDEGILIIGSGLSYHNLRQFVTPTGFKASAEFDQWLNHALADKNYTERTKSLQNWESAPSARVAHPQEDHLMPLMVALGAAENETCTSIYHEDKFMGGLTVSGFRFG